MQSWTSEGVPFLEAINKVTGASSFGSMLTFMSERHFHFERLEIIGHIGLYFSPHSLTSPLLEAIKLLVDIHDAFLRKGMDDPVVC